MNLQGKSVLVTGAEGFIGSHLSETLAKRGAKVTALSQYNAMGSYGWLDASPLAKDMRMLLGDVRDAHFCREMMRGIDVVFNLAALIAIPYSYVAPDSYVATNVQGALYVCQAARDAGCARVVQISTSEVYGTARYVPIDEKHPMQPQSPYSASKIGADAIAMSFHHTFDVPVVLARPFNAYGPRQSTRAVIPTIITQIASGQSRIKIGALSPTRDFTFVQDTVDGLLALAACDEAVGKTVNIGTNFEISIGDTIGKIQALMGSSLPVECEEARLRPTGSEVNRLWCDNTLLRSLSGFTPAYDIDKGLKETIDWFTRPENLARYHGDRYHV